MKFFHIPLLGMHIHHRRKASAVTGRETGFEEIHAFNRLIVERREKTADMIHLIDRITIDQKKVLIEFPPLTYKPEIPSVPADTPGVNCKVRIISASPTKSESHE